MCQLWPNLLDPPACDIALGTAIPTSQYLRTFVVPCVTQLATLLVCQLFHPFKHSIHTSTSSSTLSVSTHRHLVMHDVYQLRSGGTCTPFTGPTFQLNQYRNAQFLNSIIHISIFIEFLNVLNMVSIWSSSKVSIWQRRPCRLPVLPMQCNALQCNATDQFEEVSSCCQYPDYNTSLD